MKPNWFYILLALAPGPRYGTAIQDDVRSLSDGGVRGMSDVSCCATRMGSTAGVSTFMKRPRVVSS